MKLLEMLPVLAVVGTALVAGIFYAFSTFVMQALGRLPSPQGIAAMQAINVAVLNPLFFSVFFGAGLLCVVVAVMAPGSPTSWSRACLVAGALLYVIGTIGVTIAGNVPWNERLAAVDPASPEASELWAGYLQRWVLWNHVRTIAAALASGLIALSRVA